MLSVCKACRADGPIQNLYILGGFITIVLVILVWWSVACFTCLHTFRRLTTLTTARGSGSIDVMLTGWDRIGPAACCMEAKQSKVLFRNTLFMGSNALSDFHIFSNHNKPCKNTWFYSNTKAQVFNTFWLGNNRMEGNSLESRVGVHCSVTWARINPDLN